MNKQILLSWIALFYIVGTAGYLLVTTTAFVRETRATTAKVDAIVEYLMQQQATRRLP